MNAASFAERARRFLAERDDRTQGSNETNEQNEKMAEDAAAASIPKTHLPPAAGGASPAADAEPGAVVDLAAVWWDDPGLTSTAEYPGQATYAPILLLPPRTCNGPTACSRLGLCERRRMGRPCGVRP